MGSSFEAAKGSFHLYLEHDFKDMWEGVDCNGGGDTEALEACV
jgi:hypothetical protein